MPVPNTSYTIWFTQRTGSSMLCATLEQLGIVGKPREWLNFPNDEALLAHYDATDPIRLQQALWSDGTSNGVFGLKFSPFQPYFSQLINLFKQLPSAPENNRCDIWEVMFPHHKHIFMTRRNKVRLAVSWWKAIQTGEGHRLHGQKPRTVDLADAYNFDAINHLYLECSMREAGIQEFFTEGGIVPLTLVYEDFIANYEETIRRVVDYIGENSATIDIGPPPHAKLADTVSEAWVQRYREERQQDWSNRGW